jgi:hypothetical protein
MIMDFSKEVAEIRKLLVDGNDDKYGMELATLCFMLFDRGAAWERDRIIHIIQRHGISPLPLIKEIRKPVR